MCFVMNKIAISILDTQDILTVLNTFSFQRPFPQLRKAQCFPITGCEEKNQHICILVDQAPSHTSSLLSRPTSPSPLPSEYDWRLVNVFGHVATAYYEDLKTRDEPAFRACVPLFPIPHSNNNKKVVLCGHNTYIFAVITSGAPFGGAPMADGSIHNQYSDARLRLSALDDPQQEHLRRRLRRCINATAGVILNATRQRWTSDTHSDYYMDGDGTVPTVSLSSILQDAVPIARILDIIAQATAEEMEYDDSLNPPDFFLAVYVLSPHLYPTAFTILYLQRVPCFY
ncbi:hypothetical protein BLNAU_17798 [Blattamonas nauphoetae]|uniref:Uncharacterized protein n=1 Tax=Blattamonas nauphoetae TaxID=2049346 RepID=A0ABQ9X9F2_9EUKA|nr:hypothetical protein BLNAU_17798 [Blattamonas nauphoetae]